MAYKPELRDSGWAKLEQASFTWIPLCWPSSHASIRIQLGHRASGIGHGPRISHSLNQRDGHDATDAGDADDAEDVATPPASLVIATAATRNRRAASPYPLITGLR